jgi:hypothetical protein
MRGCKRFNIEEKPYFLFKAVFSKSFSSVISLSKFWSVTFWTHIKLRKEKRISFLKSSFNDISKWICTFLITGKVFMEVKVHQFQKVTQLISSVRVIISQPVIKCFICSKMFNRVIIICSKFDCSKPVFSAFFSLILK